MSNELVIEKIGGVMVVRFSRPESRNPLSISVLEQVHALVDKIASDINTTKLIFTGTGHVFASGADLREIAAVTAETAREFALHGQTLMKKIADLPLITIAAVNGYCFGGALDLALACKYRIASPDAQFSHPGAGLGIITGWGGTQRLPRLVGEAAALAMLLTGKRVGADDALRMGLVDEIAHDPLAAAVSFENQFIA